MSYYSSSTASSDYSVNDLLQIPNLLSNISKILCELINKNGKGKYNKNNPFCSKRVPIIPITEYLQRFKHYTNIENSTLIISIIYIDIICQKHNITIQQINVHRLVLICCVLAIKYNEDIQFTNNYYAKVGGISNKEMNLLEFHSIKLLDYNLSISETIFNKYVNYLRKLEFKS